jgi:hypothetical protein
MGRQKLKIHSTDLSNIVSNLRGEVGEIVTSWVFLRDYEYQAQQLRSGSVEKDFHNPDLQRLNFLCNKFADEIISRLSELSERKIGQINFYFASVKLSALKDEVADFAAFIASEQFKERRNSYISHKALPQKWEDHRASPFIPYRTIVQAIARAVHLMKKVDTIHLGPRGKHLWHEMRRRRYELFYPPRAGYMLLPYLRLSNRIRLQLIAEETAIGRQLWTMLPTKINGKDVTVRACKEWGVVQLGNRLVVLEQYPLIELKDIEIG